MYSEDDGWEFITLADQVSVMLFCRLSLHNKTEELIYKIFVMFLSHLTKSNKQVSQYSYILCLVATPLIVALFK